MPAEAKGLEFDSVLAGRPGRDCSTRASRGHSDLYVALTRATQRLTVLYPGELPDRAAPPHRGLTAAPGFGAETGRGFGAET